MRYPTAASLAMRDPAYAALMGGLPQDHFGAESDFGSPDVSQSLGFGFGLDYGAEPAMLAPAKMHPAHVAAALQEHAMRSAHTSRREALLDPNQHSTTKVERYSFSLNQAITLGTALTGFNVNSQPTADIRPQRVIMNAPVSNFVIVTGLLIANVNVFIGSNEDAVNYNNMAQGVMLDLPTLRTQFRATCTGNYTGLIPPGFANGFAFTFIVTLQGPAVLAGAAGGH